MVSRTAGSAPVTLPSNSAQQPGSVVPISSVRPPNSRPIAKQSDVNLLISTLASGSGACLTMDVAVAESASLERAPEIVARQLFHALRLPENSSLNLKPKMHAALLALANADMPEADRRRSVTARTQGLMGHYAYRDQDPAVQKMVMRDWMEALEPYPYYAVKGACQAWLSGQDRHKHPMPFDIADKAATRSLFFRELWRMVSPQAPLSY